jgi:Spy/CpxP family protein refolding chaperone
MAVYKVIQDVEAEDKLLGPLSFKALVYAGIAGTCAFINFRLFLIGSPLKWLFILMFAIPMILFGVLAAPLGREQPTEVWLLSRIKFFFKPRKRIWNQEGISQLVTITTPKKEEKQLTKDLSPTEVSSRLKTLASTLDTRGWAIKNADVNLSTPDVATSVVTPESDRLVGGAGVPQQIPVVDVHAADDILDEKHNPIAQKFEALMQKAETDRKHSLLSKLKGLVDNEALTKKTNIKNTKELPAAKAVLAKAKKEELEKRAKLDNEGEEGMDEKFAEARASLSVKTKKKDAPQLKILTGEQAPEVKDKKQEPKATPPPVTATNQTANMELAQSGSAFSVATLSKMANRPPKVVQTGPNEITISLH